MLIIRDRAPLTNHGAKPAQPVTQPSRFWHVVCITEILSQLRLFSCMRHR